MKKIIFPLEVHIDKLIPSGEGVGFFDGIPVYVYGLLPGEKALIEPRRKVSRKIIEGYYTEIIEAASFRRAPQEEHFLSCSPWQVIPEEKQKELKKNLVYEVFEQKAGAIPLSPIEIVSAGAHWSYRNKMEFSFTESDGKLCTAFYQRSKYNRFLPAQGCLLAHPRINACAQGVVKILRQNNISWRDVKNLGMRYSFSQDQCLVSLYVKNENFPVFDLSCDGVVGSRLIYSTPLSPAACMTKIIHQQGQNFLTEKVGDYSFKYFVDSFFQVNPTAFGSVLNFVKEHVEPGASLVDLYAGVGTIGLFLSKNFTKVCCVESDTKATEALLENCQMNQINNVSVVSLPAEKTDLKDIFRSADTLIIDPPRGGLHPKVVKAIKEFGPKNFIYVSCNPSSQAQDFLLLKESYRAVSWRLFDLYPQTPHVESVLVLKRMV